MPLWHVASTTSQIGDPVATIIVTKRVHELIRSKSVLPFINTARELPGGFLAVDISDEVYEALCNESMEGETTSDTIERVIATRYGTN